MKFPSDEPLRQALSQWPSDEQVRNAVTDFPTWHAMVHDGLPAKRQSKPKTAAHPKVVA